MSIKLPSDLAIERASAHSPKIAPNLSWLLAPNRGGIAPSSESRLEDRHNRAIDVVFRVQDDHVGNPTNVPDLLLAQLDPSIKHPEVVLLLKGHLEHVHVVLVHQILDGLD